MRSGRSSLAAILGMGAAALAAGCQLLLPTAEDDGRGARGGAGSSSTDATTTGKTSSSSKASASGVTTGTDASSASSGPGGNTTVSANASSSSGGGMCAPSGSACNGLGSSSLPNGCPPTVTCGANTGCSAYCSAMREMCPEQWDSDATCCGACGYFQGKAQAVQCCHVDALNDLAASSSTPSSCTLAGPFGSDTMRDSPCGTQANNLCEIYVSICPNQQALCNKSQCVAYFAMTPAVTQYAANANTDALSMAMDDLLSGASTTCASLASQFCNVVTDP